MEREEANGSRPQPDPTPLLNTEEEVAKEIKEWMIGAADQSPKSCENAVSYIESQLKRPLYYLETTWFERQYVITLLELWLEKSLGKAFEYVNNENNDISRDMSTLLSQLDSINSFEDIRSKLNDAASPLQNLCDGECPYFQLILEQEDLFTNTPRFIVFVNCYFKQFKTSCTEKIFFRCLRDVVKDETHGKKKEKFITNLNEFLANVNEDKILLEKMMNEHFHEHFVENDSITGQDLIKKLVEMFVECSKNNFLKSMKQEENLNDDILVVENINDIENITAADWQGLFHRLVKSISQSFLQQTDGSQTAENSIPKWFTHYEKASSLLNEVEWTSTLQVLTKETCKKFLLPKTEIEFKEEDGKRIISIRGVAIFVSKMIEKMKQLKGENPDVEEIKIFGAKSVHIDCDLDYDTWHGINMGIVTDKLIVDDVTNDESGGVCWNVSGKNAKDQPPGERRHSGESGGNVHVVCNRIINGQKWTIVSDGGNGGAAYKWTKEEFEKSFPPMSTGVGEKNIETVLKTLEKILPKEKRAWGENILPGHKGNFFISGTTDDGSKITATFYQKEKEKPETLISIGGGEVGQGGYGGDISIECFRNSEVNSIPEMPFTGKDKTTLTAVRLGVYEASGHNGKLGEASGDVALIHKGGEKFYYGFDKDQKIVLIDVEEAKRDKDCVKYQAKKEIYYAKLNFDEYPEILPYEKIIKSAIKKKAVIRQSLVWHFDQIDERKQLTKSIQMMLCDPTECHTNSTEEIIEEMVNKVQRLHHQMTQRQQHQQPIEQEQYVKPSMNTLKSFPKPKIIGRRPVYKPSDKNEYETKPPNVNCLVVLATEDGIDSALHCLFGQITSDGKFVCKDTNKLRQILVEKLNRSMSVLLAEHDVDILIDEDPRIFVEYIAFIKSFIEKNPQRTEYGNDLFWLNPAVHSFRAYKWEGSKTFEDIATLRHLFKEKWEGDATLKQEYDKYIESLLSHRGTLGLFELGMLAHLLKLTIHVYKGDGVLSHQYQQTLNPMLGETECSVLYEDNSTWKRLTPNRNLNFVCREFTTLETDEPNCNQTSFEKLKSRINANEEITNKDAVNTCIEKFNPKANKTPDKLSQLLLGRINNMDVNNKTKELVQAIFSLSKWVDYYNTRNVSPFFYLHIVKSYKPQEWEREFILLEMEERLVWKDDGKERQKWREEMSNLLNNNDRALPLLTKIAMEKKDNDILFSLDSSKLLRMLRVAEESVVQVSFLNEKDLDKLSLIDWFYKAMGAFWEKKVDEWFEQQQEKIDKQLTKEKKTEYVNLLLQLEYKNKQDLLQKFTHNFAEEIEYLFGKIPLLTEQNSTTESKEKQKNEPKTAEKVIEKMMEFDKEKDTFNKAYLEKLKGKVNKSEPEKVKSIFDELVKINKKLKEKQSIKTEPTEKKTGGCFRFFRHNSKPANENMSSRAEYDIGKEIQIVMENVLYLDEKNSIEIFLGVFDYAVKLKMGFNLRGTQRVAITILLENIILSKKKTLAQVSTGEGKSIIVAGVAIGLVLLNRTNTGDERKNKVDVITSNDVLALRDSRLSVDEGGLKEIYEFFNVTVSNNCSKSVDDRQRAYNMDVVYGQLANFQRDYLLDKFYNKNIRGDRRMENVIIDEVDCMLLDRGNNMLYLSHDIPGMEMLESIYVFIWEQIRVTKGQMNEAEMKAIKKQIKSTVLYDLYGQISEENLNSIYAPGDMGQEELKERTAIWDHLIEKQIIDRRGRLLINDVTKITEEKINYMSTNEALKEKKLNSKITFYLRTVVKRKRQIRIPSHLLDFVDRHLGTWLDNARRALELKQDEDYVIDHDRSDTSPDLNPQVIIIDPDTGTDQSNSQWDGALHQFLQLKEGCKLTLQSLKAVFISNATYIKNYRKLAGVSGTLGSEPEQKFLKNKYRCKLFTIPSAFPKHWILKPAKLLKTKESWQKAIIEETRQTIKNRSIVIFCRSIKEVNQIYQHLKSTINELRQNKICIHRYTRDYEKFEFEKEPGLDVGNVIVATNLAGRGTDIKLSPKLIENGGLHICLTYFPENERVEKQAMGRAARKGEPGSGILILCPTEQEGLGTSEKWDVEKLFVMKEKRAWNERQRISRLITGFKTTIVLEYKFAKFKRDFSVMKVTEEVEKLKNEKPENNLVQLLDNKVMITFVQGNVLDKWTLWLDETEYIFKCFNLKPEDDFKLIDYYDLTSAFFTSSTPARKIAIANDIASTETDSKETATAILNQLIDSNDKFLYPTALYYHAFILLTEIKRESNNVEEKKRKLIRTLRYTETILNEHIDMQINFRLIHKSNQTPSFCAVDGYKKQKENNIEILQCLIDSIQSLLGTNYFSPWDLQELLKQLEDKKCEAQKKKKASENKSKKRISSGVKEITDVILTVSDIQSGNKPEGKEESAKKIMERQKKADRYFQSLVGSKCIACQINDPQTVPNYSDVIRKIANKYQVQLKIETFVSVFKKGLNTAKEIENELKEKKLIMCSRKAFWTTLVNAGALIDTENCIVMNDSECDEKLFDPKEEIKVPNDLHVQYKPKYVSQACLEKNGKIVFPKNYVKDTLSTDYYRRKQQFEFNKIAQINFEKLKTVDLKAFGQITKDHLRYANFTPTERKLIWNELKKQKIIDDQGFHVSLAPEFKYPNCPVYEEAIKCLIIKTFPAEFVRRKWLQMESKVKGSDEYLECFKSINLLPEKPYREMLGELMAAHVISGVRVADDMGHDVLEQEVKRITKDKEERDCLLQFLKERQADYVTDEMKPNNFTLPFLKDEINARNYMTNLSTELQVFSLVGFDRIIKTVEGKKSWITKAKAGGVFLGGVAQYGIGVAMNLIPLGIANSLVGDLTKTGLDDFYFGWKALNSPNDLMIYYRRQKIESLKESGGLLRICASLA